MEENKDLINEENTEPEEIKESATGEEALAEVKPEYVYNWSADGKNEPERLKQKFSPVVLLSVICAVLAIALIATVGTLAFVLSNGDKGVSELSGASVAGIAEECSPCTVAIEVKMIVDGETKYGVGTGIILTENGYIATNSHVINEAESITVINHNGKEYSAKVIAEDTKNDIALLRVNPDEGEKFKAAKIGDYKDVRTGDRVIAIGTPYSTDLAWTVSVGHVSYLDRDTVTYGGGVTSMIQIDVPVNRGNSGGPLINENGEVIGIVTQKLKDGYEGINFAIPISEHEDFFFDAIDDDMAKPQLGVTGVSVEAGAYYLIKDRGATRVYLDETGYYIKGNSFYARYDLTEEESRDVRHAEKSGFMILGTVEGSDAEGKLKMYDIVTSFDGKELKNDALNDPYDTVVGILGTKKASDIVEVKYLRDGKEYTVKLALKEKE